MSVRKPIESLGVEDFLASRVWRYLNNDGAGDTLVTPVKKLPTEHLRGRVVVSTVQLAGGRSLWAILGNLDPNNAVSNEHFRTLSVFHDGTWIHLPRYHDPDWTANGPDTFAERLGLALEHVFPIAYDVRELVCGAPEALAGRIESEPQHKLTRAQRIALALE